VRTWWVLVAGEGPEVAAARPPSPPGMKSREREANGCENESWRSSSVDRSVDSTTTREEIGQPIGPLRKVTGLRIGAAQLVLVGGHGPMVDLASFPFSFNFVLFFFRVLRYNPGHSGNSKFR
jgi:hypothetical protein